MTGGIAGTFNVKNFRHTTDDTELVEWGRLLDLTDIVVTSRGGVVLSVYYLDQVSIERLERLDANGLNPDKLRHCIVDWDDVKETAHDYDYVGQTLEDMIDARFTITAHV